MLAWLAVRCLNAEWQNLEIRLLATYEIYRSSLKTNVPEIIVRALVAGEDHRFYQHSGVDFIGILAALRRSMWQRRIYGASTINQQLIRVLTNRYERTLKKKNKRDSTCEPSYSFNSQKRHSRSLSLRRIFWVDHERA